MSARKTGGREGGVETGAYYGLLVETKEGKPGTRSDHFTSSGAHNLGFVDLLRLR